jgi:hypothetical protein
MIPKKISDISDLNPTLFQRLYFQPFTKTTDVQFLYDNFFQDFSFYIHPENHHISLYRDDTIYYYTEDSKTITKSVRNIIPNFHPKLLPFYFIFSDKSIICLNDCWTLLGWVNHILNFSKEYPDFEDIYIIHFDSHHDLRSPLIGLNSKGNMINLVTSHKFNPFSFWDIFTSILSGCIGIGSFIVPLTFFFKKVHILHVNQFNKETIIKNPFYYQFKTDSFFEKGIQRLTLTSDLEKAPDYTCLYYSSNCLDNLINYIPSQANVYLHIDMDFFNNKFDGSGEKNRNPNYDISYSEQINMINQLKKSLNITKIIQNTKHTSIALSPGFYPSIYWESVTNYLKSSLAEIGININPSYQFPVI